MKTAIVPAQITTVEDKVTGNLSLSQLLLLATPIFGGSVIYILVPPVTAASALKIGLIIALTVLCGLFAIRIRGRILLFWAVILLRYNARPRYHVFDKNDLHLRRLLKTVVKPASAEKTVLEKEENIATESQLSMSDVVKLEQLMAHPEANLHFITDRKGGLSVRITEVK